MALIKQWAEIEAEIILDALTAYDGPNDLLKVQEAIAKALCRSYEMGRNGKLPDEYTF